MSVTLVGKNIVTTAKHSPSVNTWGGHGGICVSDGHARTHAFQKIHTHARIPKNTHAHTHSKKYTRAHTWKEQMCCTIAISADSLHTPDTPPQARYSDPKPSAGVLGTQGWCDQAGTPGGEEPRIGHLRTSSMEADLELRNRSQTVRGRPLRPKTSPLLVGDWPERPCWPK